MQNIEAFSKSQGKLINNFLMIFPSTSHHNIDGVYKIKNTNYTKCFKQNNLMLQRKYQQLNSCDENQGLHNSTYLYFFIYFHAAILSHILKALAELYNLKHISKYI